MKRNPTLFFSIVINILGSIQVFTFYEMQFIWLTQKFEEKYSHSDSLGRITGHKSDCGWLKKKWLLKNICTFQSLKPMNIMRQKSEYYLI